MFTVSVDSIALMPCNPNIGGSSKGHLVRELDALGGEMGKNIDKTFIQSKMLNESKGPAVHSLRAQADKQDYTSEMRRVLENTDHLTIRQAEISEILTEPAEEGGEKKRITGVDVYKRQPLASLLPSFCLVCPSNWGSSTLMLMMAVSPSRISSPERAGSFSFKSLFFLP